jgi:DNA-binding IclR family transcriptional regulator
MSAAALAAPGPASPILSPVPTVPAVTRALGVLELLVYEGKPLALGEIVERTGIPTASCHAIMHTLLQAGYVTRRGEGRTQFWEPTMMLYALGATLGSRLRIRELAGPHLRELSAELGVPAHLGVLVGADVMYLEKAAAPSFIKFDTFPGKLSPFHVTALGRAIAAHLSADEREQLLKGLPARLGEVLAETRAAGFALEDSEETDGVGCVAAPVFGPDGRVLASVGITGFSSDLFPDGGIPSVAPVRATAQAISDALAGRVAAAQPV